MRTALYISIILLIIALAGCSLFGSADTPPLEQAPTEALVEEPTEAPVVEPTEAPVEEPTEAPVEEPTEAPVEEPTEAPPAETTPDPNLGKAFTSEVIACPEFITHGEGFMPNPDYVAGKGLENLIEEVEGQTYECGLVYVPENYAEPDGRIIPLFYLRLFSFSDSPAPDPLINLAGGPGGSGAHEPSGFAITLNSLNYPRADRDIIAYDQRGTGYSNYLHCEMITTALAAAAERFPEARDQIDLALEEGAIGSSLKKNICMGEYQDAGVEIPQYNSVSSALDIMHLAGTLGYTEGYNLVGSSYGTRLEQFAMDVTPDTVRSVIMDGVVARSISNVSRTAGKIYEHYEFVFERCAADEACNNAYPDLPERFGALLAALEENPIRLDPPLVVNPGFQAGGKLPPSFDSITPYFFIQYANFNNLYSAGYEATVPRIIATLEQGDTTYLNSLIGVDAQLPPPPDEPPYLNPVYQASEPLLQPSVDFLIQFAMLTAANAAAPDAAWNAIALGDLSSRLQAGEPETDIFEALLNWVVLATGGLEPQVLIDYANGYLSESAAAAANELVAGMSRDQVRDTIWTAQDISMLLGNPISRDFAGGMQTAVNCNDDILWTSVEEQDAYIESLPWPQLLSLPRDYARSTLTECLTIEPVLDASVTEPVVSDIPALLLLGGIDVQTPPSWGLTAAETLSNSTVVLFDRLGHVVQGKDGSGCVGTMMAAFLNDPSVAPDTSCAEDPRFDIPFQAVIGD